MTAARSTDPSETYRKAELQLRGLLLGNGTDTPGLVKGEERRLLVTTALRHLREAFAALESDSRRADVAEARVDELEEDIRTILAPSSQTHAPEAETAPTLLTAAESAEMLRVSVDSIYRAVRTGELRAVRLTSSNRGTIRIPRSELDRILQDVGASERPAVHARRA
jgi:excisionase family DNA binding protein